MIHCSVPLGKFHLNIETDVLIATQKENFRLMKSIARSECLGFFLLKNILNYVQFWLYIYIYIYKGT